MQSAAWEPLKMPAPTARLHTQLPEQTLFLITEANAVASLLAAFFSLLSHYMIPIDPTDGGGGACQDL